MSTLQLGEHLTVKIKMPEIYLSNPSNERASLAPTGHFWNEKIRTGEFHIGVEGLLEFGNGFEQSPGFWIRLDIHIDGFCPPAKKQCGCSTGEVNDAWSLDALTKGFHELVQPGYFGDALTDISHTPRTKRPRRLSVK